MREYPAKQEARDAQTPGPVAHSVRRVNVSNPNQPQTTESPASWRWYCRLCGAEDSDETEFGRGIAAERHAQDCELGSGSYIASARAGKLLHVWRYDAARFGTP